MGDSFEHSSTPDTGFDEEIAEPKVYRVIMLNDHYSTMDFVVAVLVRVFRKTEQEAVMIMMNIHQKGQGDCGVYTYDIARTKINQVHTLARQNGYPLKCVMEEA
jgi:ATP-dependent Clp protease adaptor protein ClpS